MAYDDEYLALINGAEEAIRALLAESAEESWIGLRTGLREIRQAIHDEERRDRLEQLGNELRETRDAVARGREKLKVPDTGLRHRERRLWWRQRPRSYRQNLILDVLGTDRLSAQEIADRINDRFGWGEPCVVFDNHLAPWIKALAEAGEVDRVSEPKHPGSGRVVFRYFRTHPSLSPEVADLERRFHEAA